MTSMKPGRTVALGKSIRRSPAERVACAIGPTMTIFSALDDDRLVGESLAAADIQQFAGVNYDSFGGLGGMFLRGCEDA